MNEVLQAVLDYIQTPQTDYALLITGPWGCGKTYFWRNVVEPELKKVKCDGTPWRPLYASLYGCQSTKDIDTQLLLASHPRLREKWTTRLTAVGGNVGQQILKVFTRFELPAIDLRWLVNTKHAVLCFDDLERTRLPMKEALGYINTFVEHEFVKTIILSNEDAITDEADKKTYAAMKEKVVGASLTFRPDLDTVFRTLVDEHHDHSAFHSFLTQNADLIRRLFDRSETHNIRALRRAMAALAVIFDSLHAGKVDPSAVARQLLYAVVPAAFELHGRGADPAKLSKILSMKLMFVAGMSPSDRRREKSDEEKYEEKFAERYLSHLGMAEWKDAVGCPPICEFLLTGFLDRAALLEWAKELTRPPVEKEERIKRLSYDAREMEDEDFERTAAQVLKEVEAGEITAVDSYAGLYYRFEWFADTGLITMTRQEVLDKFVKGLRKAQEAGRLEPEPLFKHKIRHPALAPGTDEGRSLIERVLEANEDALGRGARKSVRALASRLKDDAPGFIDALVGEGESGLLFTPVFHELDAGETVVRILALPNSLKVRFVIALDARYERDPPPAEFAVELPVLAEIRDTMKRHCEAFPNGKKPMPMSLFVVREIVGVLDRAIERLRQIEQQKEAPASKTIGDQPPDGSNPDVTNGGDGDEQDNHVRNKRQ